jgi:hypothetical protein
MVYVVTDDGTMYQISASEGKEQWQVDGIREFLSASEHRLYCRNRARRVAILEAKTGSKIGAIPTEDLDLAFANTATDRIFIGTAQGVVQCLRETQQRWPLIHLGGLEEESEEQAAKKAQPAAPASGTPEGGPPADLDPFGAGGSDPFGGGATGGDDPFGGGSSGTGGDDPFGGGGAGGDDPFGGSGAGAASEDPFGGADPFGP